MTYKVTNKKGTVTISDWDKAWQYFVRNKGGIIEIKR